MQPQGATSGRDGALSPTARRSLLALGGGALIGAVLLGAVLFALDAGYLREPLLRIVASRSGHPIHVEDLSVRVFGGPPRIVAKKVVIGNPAWMPGGGNLAEIGELALTLEPTLRHPLKLRTLAMAHGVLRPRRDEAGRASWRVREKPGPAGDGLLPIELLRLDDIEVEYEDARRHLVFRGRVATRTSEASAPLRLTAKGELNGRAVDASLTGEPLARARRDRAWHFDFDQRSSGTHLKGKGSVLRPFDFSRLDVEFEVQGADLRDLYYLVGLKLPDTGPYTGSGKLERRGARLAFSELRARSGETDIAGTYVSDSSGKRPTFTAELHSRRARTRDLGARAAGRERPHDGPPRAVPDVRIPLQGLRNRDGQVRYRADQLSVGPLTLRDVDTTIRIDKGVLTAAPLTAGASDGKLEGRIAFDARNDTPEATLDVTFDDLQIGTVFQGKRDTPPAEGKLRGALHLVGKGESLHALAAHANGDVDAILHDGTIRESLAEVLGVNLRGLGLMMSRSRQMIPLRCARARFAAHDGHLVAQELVIDTEPAVIQGSGTVDLEEESIDLRFQGRPKSMRFRMRTPLLVQGTFSHPAPRLETRPTTLQGGAALALGALVTPVAAAAAFIDPGRARDLDCEALGSR